MHVMEMTRKECVTLELQTAPKILEGQRQFLSFCYTLETTEFDRTDPNHRFYSMVFFYRFLNYFDWTV